MESLWLDVDLPKFPALVGHRKADVLVVGGGIAGILCARKLKDAGLDVVLLEAADLAGGITKNTTAKVTSQHGLIYRELFSRFGIETAGLYLEANEKALGEIRNLSVTIDCNFEEKDNFIYSRENRAALEAEMAVLQALGYPAELVDTVPLPFPNVGAVKFPRQGQFHPRKFLAAMMQGLTVFEHSPVRELRGTTAVTDRGTVSAEKIIVATHFPFLNKHGSYFMKLYQQRSYVLALEKAPLPEGMYLDAAENGLSFRTYGKMLLLGGGGHRTGKTGGNWQVLEGFAEQHYPGAVITWRWAAQDCMTLDGMPYIGQYSARTPHLYVATGFNKWGMTSAMVSAQLLTDLILGKENPYRKLFSPSRSMLHPQLGINLMESTVNLLTPTAPRCPHLGCALKWNSQEHSWDCPCHGSRFTAQGQLIDNPATGDMKKRE